MVELVYIIIIIKGHYAAHLKVVGLLTPFAALQVWQSAVLYHFTPNFCIIENLAFAALEHAYVMLKQCNV